jgi:hypothetical protein
VGRANTLGVARCTIGRGIDFLFSKGKVVSLPLIRCNFLVEGAFQTTECSRTSSLNLNALSPANFMVLLWANTRPSLLHLLWTQLD